MNIQLLGTSSGVPTKTRHVSATAFWLDQCKDWYLIDCGEGTQFQLLKIALSPNRLLAIFVTHVHGDHCFGLPGLISSMTLYGRTKPLRIMGPPGVQEMVTQMLNLSQARINFDLEFKLVSETALVYVDKRVEVTACALSHRVPSYAYAFKETNLMPGLNTAKLKAEGIEQGPLWGKLKQGEVVEWQGKTLQPDDYLLPAREPRCVVIAGDNDKPECLLALNQRIDALVHEATFTQDVLEQVGPTAQHSSARMVAQFAATAGIPNLILTHFSARFSESERSPQPISLVEQEARDYYHGELFLAQDLAHFNLSSDKQLSRVTENQSSET